MGIIRRLSEDVVKRIAAGEVVVRPANAVKELIENSLDAHATEITVTVKEGGLALLQVQDNGIGIQKNDLDIVCERFTTSKLTKFEDLQSMKTYGFRGEALSSLSHVAKVTITSKTSDQHCAYRATYIDGKLESLKPSAGLNGTCIAAENLFYNCLNRRKALQNYNDEAARIADVVMRYAVYRPDISFAMRRGGIGGDFRTSGKCSRAEVITSLLGKDCGEIGINKYTSSGGNSLLFDYFNAANMIDFTYVSQRLHYSCHLCLTPPVSSVTARSVQAKKIDPARIDVNLHPTKQTVVFLEEEAIIEELQKVIENKLGDVFDEECAPRSINKQQKTLTATQIFRIHGQGQPPEAVSLRDDNVGDRNQPERPSIAKKRADYTLIRVDKKERRLDEFISRSKKTQSNSSTDVVKVLGSQDDDSVQTEIVNGQQRRVFQFESLNNLRRNICNSASQPLRELFKSFTYVGCISPNVMLLQFGTALYAAQLEMVLRELFYQTIIFSFGNFGSLKLGAHGANILKLLQLAGLESEHEMYMLQLLEDQAHMLNDYFSLQIARPGGAEMGNEGLRQLSLLTIPSVIAGHKPQMEGLPSLMLSIVKNVNWEEEECCFRDVSRALADFFLIKEDFCDGVRVSGGGRFLTGLEEGETLWEAVIRDVLIPRVKSHLVPADSLRQGVTRLADLHDLYKVFERC